MLLALALQLSADATALMNADFRSCGIDQSRVMTDYRDDLQDGVAAVSGSAKVSDDQLQCLAKATVDHGYIIAFADAELNARFADKANKAFRESRLTYARGRLAAFGALDKLPVFDPKRESVDAFVSKVELMCGAKPRSVIRRISPTELAIDDRMLRRVMRDSRAGRQVECVQAVLGATDLDSAGVRFGFVGNEEEAGAP